jgi:subfamily B ATP-binding cassette protein MsbA
MSEEYTYREKAAALSRVARFRPGFAVGVILLSIFAALLEGIGLSFLLPILELAQGEVDPAEADGVLAAFVSVYELAGLPFTLGFMIVGVVAVMTIRFTSSFLVGWLRTALQTMYIKELQSKSFERALGAEVAYFDEEGSDDILNAIVTQSEYASKAIRDVIGVVEQGFLALIYFAIAFVLAPWLAVATGLVLGGIVALFKHVLEAGSAVGDRVADANEELQESVQAGTQGIRDVKMFGMESELLEQFSDAIDKFARSNIKVARNQQIIRNFYQLVIAITVFVLIYVSLVYTSMSLSALGIFLFAIFRLGPKVSTLSTVMYRLDSELPHLIRTHRFIDEIESYSEPDGDKETAPTDVGRVEFNDVQFSYRTAEEQVLRGVSFTVERDELVAFVGPSGAGKSTVLSLFARLYEPNSGSITAEGTRIDEYPVWEWRDRIALVRQDPYIFNDTLYYNVTVGAREAPQREIERVCEIAQVTEFLDDLPKGYDTHLGDDGTRLSGGQRQRIAIARALLKDAEFLLLDEATSDLDTGLEEKVHSAIENMDRDYGMIVVAHRLSTVTSADRIYSMKNGHIIESGDHTTLLKNGRQYSELYTKQTSEQTT